MFLQLYVSFHMLADKLLKSVCIEQNQKLPNFLSTTHGVALAVRNVSENSQDQYKLLKKCQKSPPKMQ